MPPLSPSLADARRVLRSTFGHDDFRPGQESVLAAILDQRDVLAVMPTGAGKSLLYQLPAAMGIAPVIVVSPLISLMRDQLRGLQDAGVPAAALHSAQTEAENAAAVAAIRSGGAKLIYVAPERLAQDGTIELLRAARPRRLAVDEAHCASHWGHEFRPDYARLAEVAERLGAPPILAVTATAGPQTRADIIAKLFAQEPDIFVSSFARANLRLAFRRRHDALRQIAHFARRREGQSGIVYCASRRRADRMAQALRDMDFDALPYHAGLDSGARGLHQDAFFTREGVVMVATIAFGMGVDKRDVRFVVHADLPDSVEGYYQEIGRAGRDGLPADALALFDPRELATRSSLAADAVGESEIRRREAMARLCVTPSCRFQALLHALGEASGKCGRCDNCRSGLFGLPRRAALVALGWRVAALGRFGAMGDAPLEEATDAFSRDAAPVALPAIDPGRARFLRVADERLFRELCALRQRIARRRRIAPRGVASDDLLRALAAERPRSLADSPFAAADGERSAIVEPEAFLLLITARARDAG
ncbi:MAG: recombinase RecQ [Methylocystaceae bacterium]|nr:MAG: recombinase RecQ [Methylocystaceae bacterium]